MHAGGLMHALHDFAAATADLFKVPVPVSSATRQSFSTTFRPPTISIRSPVEATTNAVKHGRAHQIVITLEPRDEGTVFEGDRRRNWNPHALAQKGGMGLTIMAQRAKLIGASFDIRPRAAAERS
jgi:signal transduction histidine kinase